MFRPPSIRGSIDHAAERARLHITPLDETLISQYLPPGVIEQATEISYHTIPTFPERPFGYVTLPVEDAQRLKKKLNGMILKGQKIRIADAKPEKWKRVADESAQDEEPPPKKTKSDKSYSEKRKAGRSDPPLSGIQLPAGRKVKRGWTETIVERNTRQTRERNAKAGKKEKDSKTKTKTREASKHGSGPELLFKTKLPPNVSTSAKAVEKKKKEKDSKRNNEVVVHEFNNTKKHPTFLQSEPAKDTTNQAQQYEDGRGWVDQEGNVIERETRAAKRKREASRAAANGKMRGLQDKTEASNSKTKMKLTTIKDEDQPKSHCSSTLQDDELDAANQSVPSDSLSEPSSSEPSSLSESEGEDEAAPTGVDEQPKDVHPLEALYKRTRSSAKNVTSPQSKPPPINTSFKFFGAGSDDEEEAEAGTTNSKSTYPPLTPHTKQDIRVRGIRSAAPTPDTAAINRKFSFSMVNLPADVDEDEDEELSDADHAVTAHHHLEPTEEDEMEDADADHGGAAAPGETASRPAKEESEFAKLFWEQRSQSNKVWRARRKEAMKQKRKRENKRLGRRMV